MRGLYGRNRKKKHDQPRSEPKMADREAMSEPNDNRSASPGQASYDRFVRNGMRMIYSKKTMPQVLKTLDGDGNPVEGLAAAHALVMKRLGESAKQAGMQVTPDVAQQASLELMNHLADLSKQSGGHAYTADEIRQAYQTSAFMILGQGGGQRGGAQPPGPPGTAPQGAPGATAPMGQRRGLAPTMAA